MEDLSVKTWREAFPIFSQPLKNGTPLIYLDSAATAQKPAVLLDTLQQFYGREYGTVNRAIYYLAASATAKYHAVREHLRQFLGAAEVSEILFTRGTTESINLVATCMGKWKIKKGDRILISAMEHHSNLVPWQMVCEERGAILEIIPLTTEGLLDMEAFKKLLELPVKFVSIAHVSNVIGLRNPVEEIVKLAHAVGAYVLVDGAQSTPHEVIDVQKMGCDFFVFSGHKLYGPTGIGILYGKQQLLEEMPPYQGGGDMIEQVTFAKTTYQKPPLRFEAGTPMIAEVISLGAVLEQLNTWGWEKIFAWEEKLMDHLIKRLEEIPQVIRMGPAGKRSSLVSFSVQKIHPLDLATFMDFRGIAMRTGHLCAQPLLAIFGHQAVSRISIGLYNTLEDIDHCIEALKQAIVKLS